MKKQTLPILICAAAIIGTGVTFYVAQDAGEPAASPPPASSAAIEKPGDAATESSSPAPSSPAAAIDTEGASQREPGALTDPISTELPFCPGKPLIAQVEVGAKQTPALVPNQVGVFPRVYMKPNQKVEIRLRFPEAEPGARAAVSVEDGGYIGDQKPAAALTLDQNREGAFEFTSGTSHGQYRVVVRQGADTRILVLWAEGQS